MWTLVKKVLNFRLTQYTAISLPAQEVLDSVVGVYRIKSHGGITL